MACEVMNLWTFCGLVGAFLDLFIAYCLLCASTVAFFASKFLGLFGLCLPCPCDGLFGTPRKNQCLQRQLVSCPFEKTSLVQLSVKSRFPFDSRLADCGHTNLRLSLGKEGNHENGHVELEGEETDSTFAEKRFQDLDQRDSVNTTDVEFGAVNLAAVKEEKFDFKGKGVLGRKMRHSLRRRRKVAVADYGKASSVASNDTLQSDAWYTPQSPSSFSKMSNEVTEDPTKHKDGKETPADFGVVERVSLCHELNDSIDDNKRMETEAVTVEDSGCDVHGNLDFDKNEKNTIRVLEQALEEEHSARSALYLELEKERSAAASAADEAMAMILRLQEEKALIEMEARQYQRMIEEKSAYDAEEMNILKEILLRREREKHFLEKEVEAYKQMIFGNDLSDSEVASTPGQKTPIIYPSEDPMMILQHINESIVKPKLNVKGGSSDNKVPSIESQNLTLAFGKELPIPTSGEDDSLKQVDMHGQTEMDKCSHYLSGDEINHEFQEKSVVSMDDNLFSQQREVCSKLNELHCQGLDLHEQVISSVVKDPEQAGSTSLYADLATKASDASYQESKDPPNLVLDTESSVYDVHVIDDESKTCNEMSIEKNARRFVSTSLNIPRRSVSASLSWFDDQHDNNRSSSETTCGLPPLGRSQEKARLTDLRRNSMSSVDYERLKIDNEVEWLRERLRVVQKGREKLNFSVGHREREKIQLQLLEDIASQLREIRQLTEPGKAERQASLPPSSSKVMSKKRRWRSASLGVHRST
ncbi:hypothetical protein UlMin_010301 [Ulmus minor]